LLNEKHCMASTANHALVKKENAMAPSRLN